ncbi:MAG: RES family NAD+ phosphorylase [Methylococcales bacterium]
MIKLPGETSHSKLKIAVIRKGTKLYRISSPSHPNPLFFNTDQSGRFNSPNSEFGICYMADGFEAAFAESLGHSVSTKYEPSENKIIEESDLKAFHIYQIEVMKTLHVGELCGSGLARLNIDNNINTSPKPYVVPQKWSLWVHSHPDILDGIRYHSRHLPDIRSEGLFERCVSKLKCIDTGAVINWSCPKTGKDILDLLEDHGWGLY